jgi:hypothetical protein
VHQHSWVVRQGLTCWHPHAAHKALHLAAGQHSLQKMSTELLFKVRDKKAHINTQQPADTA